MGWPDPEGYPVETGFCPSPVRARLESALSRETRLRPLLVLSAGFGGLILFILAAAIGTLVMLDRVRGDETRIRLSFQGRLLQMHCPSSN